MANKPRILFWDLETLPIVHKHIAVLPEYNSDRFGLTLRADVNSLLCFGYKFLGDKKADCINAWDFKSGQKNINDDKEVIKAAYEILKTADGVVTHNGKGFDLKFFNTRCVLHGLQPLPEIPHIDTKQLASKNLFFIRNRLDYIAERLETSRKMENGGWALWERLSLSSHKGPYAPSAKQTAKDKQTMSKYCAQDVEVLEKIYLKLRPFMKNIPNYNLWSENTLNCPSCGSNKVFKNGIRANKTSQYQRYTCQDCGSSSKMSKKGTLLS